MQPVRHRASQPLRAWQRSALQTFHDADRPRDFLVTATPGSGKTTFALTLAIDLLRERRIDRVIVVCPTDHLRTQWAEAAHAAGLDLDPSLANSASGGVRPGMLGYVTTYAQVAAKPVVHDRRCLARRTLVILDEVHHAGDGLSWGDAVAEAFGSAARRLCLTGTPFRTRVDERIPFVRYEQTADGGLQSQADVTYGYRDALADGVVRPVVFAAYTGVTRWRNSAGEVISASLSEEQSRQSEAAAWRTALDPRGRWVPHVLAAMAERIDHLRESGMHDAAGLVLATDQEDARAYARIVEQVTGEPAVLIVSDDREASARISEFSNGRQRIAVCVRMVSEGVDIPRAACLAWLTSYRTPLFFAQAVGRVVRSRASGESATVFLPAVRPLLSLAADMEFERNHVLPPPSASSEELDVERPERDAADLSAFEALEADAEFAHVLHAGRAVVASEVAGDDEDYLGLPGLLSAEQTALLLSRRDADARRAASAAGRSLDEEPDAEVTAWRASAALRRELNRLVSVVAARERVAHALVHDRVRRAVPGPPSAAAGTAVLQQRHDYLMALLQP